MGPHVGENVCLCKDDRHGGLHEEAQNLLPWVLLGYEKVFSSQSTFSTRDQQVGLEKADFMVFSIHYPLGQRLCRRQIKKDLV